MIIFYVLGYCFLKKRMRRDIIKLFKAYMLLMIFLLSLLPEPFMLKHWGGGGNTSGRYPGAMDGRDRGSRYMG